jgi:carbon monoxide dehydrogenase subunit G
MEMNEVMSLPCSQSTAWAALNDIDILRQCIPGCTELSTLENGRLAAKLTIKVGPIKVNLSAVVSFEDVQAPNGYRLVGEGKGGPAGFAKGVVNVRLEPAQDCGTLVHYVALVDVGGKLAQIGSRLLDATARKYAGEFFERFAQLVLSEAPASRESQ